MVNKNDKNQNHLGQGDIQQNEVIKPLVTFIQKQVIYVYQTIKVAN
jgi:hypothetical protein